MPTRWGDVLSTKSHSLYMDGETQLDELQLLENTSFTDPAKNELDPVFHPYTVLIGGQNVTRESTIRSAEVTRYTGNILFNGDQWTPLKELFERGNCETTLYSITNCADPKQERAQVYTKVNGHQPIETTAIHDANSDVAAITEQSEVDFVEKFKIWALRTVVVQTVPESGYDLTIKQEDCIGCTTKPFQSFAFVATDGGSFKTYTTTDRFATVTDQSALGSAAPADSIPHTIAWIDDNILVGFSDASGTAGGTSFSSDGGATATPDSNLTLPVYEVGRFDGQWLAVGGALAGQAMVWLSDDGIAWTSVSSGSLPADKALLSFDIDYSNDTIYMSGENGLMLKATRAGSNSLTISALTLPGTLTATDINDVRVLDIDRVAVVGEGGYYAETLNGGTTWSRPTITVSSEINSIAGDRFRTVYGSGTVIGNRDPINKNKFKNLSLEAGSTLTGNIVSIVNLATNRNYFAYLTDTGRVAVSTSYAPRQ